MQVLPPHPPKNSVGEAETSSTMYQPVGEGIEDYSLENGPLDLVPDTLSTKDVLASNDGAISMSHTCEEDQMAPPNQAKLWKFVGWLRKRATGTKTVHNGQKFRFSSLWRLSNFGRNDAKETKGSNKPQDHLSLGNSLLSLKVVKEWNAYVRPA